MNCRCGTPMGDNDEAGIPDNGIRCFECQTFECEACNAQHAGVWDPSCCAACNVAQDAREARIVSVMRRACAQWLSANLFNFPVWLYPNGITIVQAHEGDFCGGMLRAG